MSRNIQYASRTIDVAAGVIDRKIALPHNVLVFDVPASTLNATVKFGDAGAEAVGLVPGGKNKFCFDTPPSAIYMTSPGGDPITVFGSQEVEPSFSPFGSDVGSLRNEIIATWPENTKLAKNAAVASAMGFTSSNSNLTMWGSKFGTAADKMGLHEGRLCYEAGPTGGATFAMREMASTSPIQMPLTHLLPRVGQEGADFSRVYWETFWMQVSGVPLTHLRTGLAYLFVTNPGSGGWWEQTNYYAWGLGIGDDGGGNPVWHYAANRVVGAPNPDEDTDLGISALSWTRFDIMHIAPTVTRRARLLIYADGVLVIEREWAAAAGSLPDYLTNAGSIIRQVIAGESTLGVTLRIGSCSFRRGQLLLTGSFA